MSVTSTRRVSGTYRSTVSSTYAATQGQRSFVEDIDTTNNVLIAEDSESQHYKQFEKSQENEAEDILEKEDVLDNHLNTSQNLSPLLDNDEEVVSVASDKNIGIYGNNQEMSVQRQEKIDNPYIKHLYESNELIEDIDEFV